MIVLFCASCLPILFSGGYCKDVLRKLIPSFFKILLNQVRVSSTVFALCFEWVSIDTVLACIQDPDTNFDAASSLETLRLLSTALLAQAVSRCVRDCSALVLSGKMSCASFITLVNLSQEWR